MRCVRVDLVWEHTERQKGGAYRVLWDERDAAHIPPQDEALLHGADPRPVLLCRDVAGDRLLYRDDRQPHLLDIGLGAITQEGIWTGWRSGKER